jgi:subtilisin-like proprotein convertase family protein
MKYRSQSFRGQSPKETSVFTFVKPLTFMLIIAAVVTLSTFFFETPALALDPALDQPRTDKAVLPEKLQETWAVKLLPGFDPSNFAVQNGFRHIGPIAALDDYHLFTRKITERSRRSGLPSFSTISGALWAEQQLPRWRYSRFSPPDPLFSHQWHLQNLGQSGGLTGQDVNVRPVWNSSFSGNGVVIAVVDDGLQHVHPDIQANYISAASWDFILDAIDPSPKLPEDVHGTSVAGVAAARDNSVCGLGVAFRAGLSGIRLISQQISDAQEAMALSHAAQFNHIYNNSWGPMDDGRSLEGPGVLTTKALEYATSHGRNGLGSIFVWAAGNGLQRLDNVNYDGYANSRFTIAVGAVDHRGAQTPYSEPGAAMLVTAPSHNQTVGITTTDLLGTAGYSHGDCTTYFGGTSASTPMVSGVIALMLEANPNLSWRDVQHILVRSTVLNDPNDDDWLVNGAGFPVNHKYGFGRIDASAAVENAASWLPVEPATFFESGRMSVNRLIPDNASQSIVASLFVPDDLELEHVEVVFSARHPHRGDLEIVLTSPSGTQSVLAQPRVDPNADYPDWKFMSVRHWGEPSPGTWTLRVTDQKPLNTGMFDSWELILHGRPRGEAPVRQSSLARNDNPNLGMLLRKNNIFRPDQPFLINDGQGWLSVTNLMQEYFDVYSASSIRFQADDALGLVRANGGALDVHEVVLRLVQVQGTPLADADTFRTDGRYHLIRRNVMTLWEPSLREPADLAFILQPFSLQPFFLPNGLIRISPTQPELLSWHILLRAGAVRTDRPDWAGHYTGPRLVSGPDRTVYLDHGPYMQQLVPYMYDPLGLSDYLDHFGLTISPHPWTGEIRVYDSCTGTLVWQGIPDLAVHPFPLAIALEIQIVSAGDINGDGIADLTMQGKGWRQTIFGMPLRELSLRTEELAKNRRPPEEGDPALFSPGFPGLPLRQQ